MNIVSLKMLSILFVYIKVLAFSQPSLTAKPHRRYFGPVLAHANIDVIIVWRRWLIRNPPPAFLKLGGFVQLVCFIMDAAASTLSALTSAAASRQERELRMIGAPRGGGQTLGARRRSS